MAIALLALFSFFSGGVCVYFIVESRRRRTLALEARLQEQAAELGERDRSLHEVAQRLNASQDHHAQEILKYLAMRKEFDARIISYDELAAENKIVKTDLRNIAFSVARQEFEQNESFKVRQQQDEKASDLGRAYLKDTQKWILSSLNQNNYAACKQRLLTAIERVRDLAVPISASEEAEHLAVLQREFERVVRAAFEREEQTRIRGQIREEQQREREAQERIDQAERERLVIEAALAQALSEAVGKHTAEIDRLQKDLADAIANSQRAVSQAQLTKAGSVYVISNVGSFGSDVFKIGMTRRLEPMDRVLELGDASVPFPFDVHMMIATADAPKLENTLHKAFHRSRLNKTNPRKEFFRTSIAEIIKLVEVNHGQVEYVADAEALQYHQSLTMSDADEEFIEEVYHEVENAVGTVAADE